LIHFLADWNFCLVPGIWVFYYFGEVITVARKPARPKFLNVFKPMFVKGQGSFDQALDALESRRSLGVFPEGTTNRHPDVLLKGYSGVAQMSLKTGVPVVPAGIRFPKHSSDRPISEYIPFSIEFGCPIHPGEPQEKPTLKKVRDCHVEIMSAISKLSGKTWNRQQRKK
jgi:1-acyl-sn-glycerol-3-phosphate acyltransferase